MRKIQVNDSVDWQDPQVHLERALDALEEMKKAAYEADGSLYDAYENTQKEIEDLYHSFYMQGTIEKTGVVSKKIMKYRACPVCGENDWTATGKNTGSLQVIYRCNQCRYQEVIE